MVQKGDDIIYPIGAVIRVEKPAASMGGASWTPPVGWKQLSKTTRVISQTTGGTNQYSTQFGIVHVSEA